MTDGAALQLVPDPYDPRQLIPSFALPREPRMITFLGLPMPPSSNNMYPTVKMRGRMIRVKSRELKLFERGIANWCLQNPVDRSLTPEYLDGKALRVHADFYFHRKSILTREGKPKRNDTSNRIKPIHDALAGIIGVDDCYFWSGSFTKHVLENEHPEHCNIRVEIIDL